MKKYLFVFRSLDTEERDACYYINAESKRINFQGSCFSGFNEEARKIIESGEFESYLSQEQLLEFINGSEEVIEKYIAILESEEALKFQETIIESEKEILKEQYDLTNEDIEFIFENYYLDYQDRSIVSCIFNDTYELGEEEADAFGYLDSYNRSNLPFNIERYFDFQLFGEDLIDGERYLELPSGKCAMMSY